MNILVSSKSILKLLHDRQKKTTTSDTSMQQDAEI
jgi:hypothetical protein